MKTLVDIDPTLLQTAMELGATKTKTATVRLALEEFVKTERRRRLIALRGSGLLAWTLPALKRSRRARQQRHARIRPASR